MTARIIVPVLILVMIILLAGCFPSDVPEPAQNPAGFFMGVWHGWIAPVSLIVGIFNENVRIYEVHNTGWWYDFGYYIAVIAGFGGIAISRGKRKKSHGKS